MAGDAFETGSPGIADGVAGRGGGRQVARGATANGSGPFGGRLVFGALAGMAVGTRNTRARSRLLGALAGATAAGLAAWAGTQGRTALTDDLGLPDLPGALAEDALAYTLARAAIRE